MLLSYGYLTVTNIIAKPKLYMCSVLCLLKTFLLLANSVENVIKKNHLKKELKFRTVYEEEKYLLKMIDFIIQVIVYIIGINQSILVEYISMNTLFQLY